MTPDQAKAPESPSKAKTQAPKRAASWLASLSSSRALSALCVITFISLVGLLDYWTGTELRVYPLYFAPLSLASWLLGYRGALLGSLLSVLTWQVSNSAAGMTVSQPYLTYLNLLAQTTGFLVVSLLISRLHELLLREENLSRSDTLTGLINRRAFYSQTEQLSALCNRNNRSLTIAYIDLDNFKCVNDRFGHARGDEVLRRVAKTLRENLRASDVAARIGGDEFMVCLPEATEKEATLVFERLRVQLMSFQDVAECALSASIGAVSWSPAPAQIDEMVRDADALMYEVKRAGKNHVRVTTRTK